MKQVKYTYCRICEPNCGVKATVINGRLTAIAGDKDHPVSKGYICPRGKAALLVHHDPDRLKYPTAVRNGVGRGESPRFERVSWGAALTDIGEKLKNIRSEHGPHSVGLFIGNPVAFDFAMASCLPALMATLGTRNIFSSGSQDCNSKLAAARRLYGSPLLNPIPDIKNIEFLILFGTNPSISQSSFISFPRPVERLQEIVKRGGRVVIIDPRRTETAKVAGEHIFIRPDTDAFLMLAMLHVIISEKLYDEDTVKAHTRGFDELGALVAEYPPRKAAEITGIKREVIEELARDFAVADNAGIHSSLGVNVGSFGSIAHWLLQSLLVITGRLDKRGSMLFCEGLADLPSLRHKLNKKRAPAVSRVGNWESLLDTMPAGIMADEILEPGDGQIKALIVVSGNPMLSVPDPEKMEKALKSLDLLISLDLYVNETGALADYVLPCKDMYERRDFTWTSVYFNPVRYLAYTDAVVKARGERRDGWLILRDIIDAAGYELGGSKTLATVARAVDRIGNVFGRQNPVSLDPWIILRGLLMLVGETSWNKLKNSPHGVILSDHRTGNFFSSRILTPDKKVNIAPEDMMAERGALMDFYKAEKNYMGLKIIHRRMRRSHNSWLHNIESLVKRQGTNRVSINTGDAAELGIKDGDSVRVESSFGAVETVAKVTDDLMPGVVSLPHGWGHDKPSGWTVARKYPGVNVNRLFAADSRNLEKFAGMSILTGIKVSVTRKA